MAITALNDYAIGDTNLTAIITTLDKTYKGKALITLSEYDTTAAPVLEVGSIFENNGALFIIDTSDITPTGYAGISNSTTFYIVYDASAGAFIYSSSAPTWSDALQGWYSGNDRYFFSMYKDSGGTLYELKSEMQHESKDSKHGDLKIQDDLFVDTIGERRSGEGVTIDGVLLKDSEVTTDVINEKTGAAGVTIDSVLLKDNKIETNTITVDTINTLDIFEGSGGAGVAVNFVMFKGGGADFSGLVEWQHYYSDATSPTESELFTELSGWVTTSGDSQAAHGHAVGGVFPAAGCYIVGISRPGPAAINISYIGTTGVSSYQQISAVGTTAATTIEIMSNFDPIT